MEAMNPFLKLVFSMLKVENFNKFEKVQLFEELY
jgi:hypothetical protein